MQASSTHRIHSAHILEISDHLPIKIEIFETREKVEALLPEIERRTGCGIIEIQDTTVRIPAKQ
jgi:PII-like signaling protein